MSLHTRLQKQTLSREIYRENLLTMLQITSAQLAGTPHAETNSDAFNHSPKQLLLIIGAQKGLCGNFDPELLRFIDQNLNTKLTNSIAPTGVTGTNSQSPPDSLHTPGINLATSDIICVGAKKFSQELRKRQLNIIQEYTGLKVSNLAPVSRTIFNFILEKRANYQSISSCSNRAETFFLQRPFQTQIYPVITQANPTNPNLNHPAQPNYPKPDSSEYIWEVAPEILHQQLLDLYLSYTIQALLFDSLVAEQAARFRSMDTANRNASDLLETSYRDYNKLRQYKITKELIELSAAF